MDYVKVSPDIWFIIFKTMSLSDLCNVIATCSTFYKIGCRDGIWQRHIADYYKKKYGKLFPNNYKNKLLQYTTDNKINNRLLFINSRLVKSYMKIATENTEPLRYNNHPEYNYPNYGVHGMVAIPSIGLLIAYSGSPLVSYITDIVKDKKRKYQQYTEQNAFFNSAPNYCNSDNIESLVTIDKFKNECDSLKEITVHP